MMCETVPERMEEPTNRGVPVVALMGIIVTEWLVAG